ncbi:hypothetical protein NSTC731_01777 [Nostoc sp. DSM 114167]|jgi:hypothetical protein
MVIHFDLGASVEYVGGIKVQHQRCLRWSLSAAEVLATPTHTANVYVWRSCDKLLRFLYVCIHY